MDDPITVVGVDPGLVHTGIVRLSFNQPSRYWAVDYDVVESKLDPAGKLLAAVTAQRVGVAVLDIARYPGKHVFVEAYRDRGNSYSTDGPMRQLMQHLGATLPGSKVIDNTGVRKVVKPALLKLLGVHKFEKTTHHQDLEAAARIALYGMLKDDELNAMLGEIVLMRNSPQPWTTV